MFTSGLLNQAKKKLSSSSMLRRFGDLRRDERGNILIMAAFMLPVMIGAMGLGAEASYRYQQQRKIQHAADVAAHGAGIRAAFGDPSTVYDPLGEGLAVQAAWDQSNGTYNLNDSTNGAIQNGAFAGQSTGPNGGSLIEVVLTETVPRLFSQMYGGTDITVSAYAVAEVLEQRDACVLALDTSASRAMEFSGSTSLNLAGCEIASNSNASDAIYQGGSSSVTADCINAVGQVTDTGGITLTDANCTAPRENQPMVSDPYGGVAEPAIEGPCVNWNSVTSGPPHATKNINAIFNHSSGFLSMRFCTQTVQMQQRINFGPGIYILDGVDMRVNANADVNGSDLMFYLVNGASVTINGSGDLNLSAMTTGDWAPILFFSSRTNTATSHQLNGSSSSSFEGVMYFPNGSLDYNGGAGIAGACTQVIGNTVTFTGNSDFRSDCTSYPFNPIVTSALVQLID